MEADIQGLRKVLGDLTPQGKDLEIQVEQLNKDLVLLKKEHEEVRKHSKVVLAVVEWL